MIFKKSPPILSADGVSFEFRHSYGVKDFVITASKHGVSFNDSPVLYNREQLDAFARTLAEAFKTYMQIKFEGPASVGGTDGSET